MTGPESGGQALTHGAGTQGIRPGWLANLMAVMLVSSLALPGRGADLLITSDLYVPGLREQVQVWSQKTGHRVIWLLSAEVAEREVADVVILAAQTAWAPLVANQFKALLPPTGGANLSPLLASPWRHTKATEDAWWALPLPTRLPMLYAASDSLETRGLALADEQLGWPAIASLANELTDPIGDIYGLCIDPVYPHAMLVRSMLTAAGESWLEPGSSKPYAGAAWLVRAEEYSRLLAASSPPNAASLTTREFATLLATNKCAMWLRPRQAESDSVVRIAVPGATAFISDRAPVVAVLAQSERSSLASEFVWWLVSAELASEARYAGVRVDVLPAKARRDRQALLQMLHQHGQQEAWLGGWSVVDQAGQLPLQRLVDGLVLPEDALAEAQVGLAAVKR